VGPGEAALDYLVDAGKEANSVYARRLLALQCAQWNEENRGSRGAV
jgi:hypothetical protein